MRAGGSMGDASAIGTASEVHRCRGVTIPLRLLVALGVLLLATGVARADDAFPRNRLQFDLGFASEVGEGGFTYAFRPVQPFELELGVGYGFTGVQLSAMPRLLFGNRENAFTVGVGFSVSPSVRTVGYDPGTGNYDAHTAVPWFNAELGYLFESDSGFALLVAGGATVSLGDAEIPGFDDGIQLSGMVLPTFRIGFGYAF